MKKNIISYDDTSFCYSLSNKLYDKTSIDDNEFGIVCALCEIIGNIHDNPELIS